MSEYIADSAALTHTADRIRAKTGGTDPITWDAAKGFGDAVDAITAGRASNYPPRDASTDWQSESFVGIYLPLITHYQPGTHSAH